jgi:hypothetical protein
MLFLYDLKHPKFTNLEKSCNLLTDRKIIQKLLERRGYSWIQRETVYSTTQVTRTRRIGWRFTSRHGLLSIGNYLSDQQIREQYLFFVCIILILLLIG